jgi:hypothetical protein
MALLDPYFFCVHRLGTHRASGFKAFTRLHRNYTSGPDHSFYGPRTLHFRFPRFYRPTFLYIQVFRCTLSVRLHSYQVKVAIDLHPRPTLQVLEVLGTFFRFCRSPGFWASTWRSYMTDLLPTPQVYLDITGAYRARITLGSCGVSKANTGAGSTMQFQDLHLRFL